MKKIKTRRKLKLLKKLKKKIKTKKLKKNNEAQVVELVYTAG